MEIELFEAVTGGLTAAGIPHMIAGSFASTYHGEPRTTADIDIVIDPTLESIRAFVASLNTERFYIDDAETAVLQRDMFNILDPSTGWKIDLIVRKDRAFSRIELDRRQPARIAGVDTYVTSLEDTILSKLEWRATSESVRQFRDVATMLTVNAGRIDDAYLDTWAAELGVTDALDAARAAAIG